MPPDSTKADCAMRRSKLLHPITADMRREISVAALAKAGAKVSQKVLKAAAQLVSARTNKNPRKNLRGFYFQYGHQGL